MPKTLRFYSLVSLNTFVVFRHLLTVFLSQTHQKTHTNTYVCLPPIGFFQQFKYMHLEPKPCSCPDDFPATEIYFREEPGFPFTWVHKRFKYYKVTQWCARSGVGI